MKSSSVGLKASIYYGLYAVEAKEILKTYFSKMGMYC